MPKEPSIRTLIDATTPIVAERLGALERGLDHLSTELKGAIDGYNAHELTANPVVVFKHKTDPELGTLVDGRPARYRFTDFQTLGRQQSIQPLTDALTRITYSQEELANRSVICSGYAGVPERLIQIAQRVNQDKDHLKAAFAPIRGRQVKFSIDGVQHKREATTELLRNIQKSDVNLQAAYRHIPLIEEGVRELNYMVIRTRKVTNATVASIQDMLRESLPNPDAIRDLNLLEAIPDNELLARPSKYYDRLRLKVILARQGTTKKHARSRTRVSRELPAELPLLFPIFPSSVPPKVSAPAPWQPPTKSLPKRLEDEPLLPSLNYFRLKAPYRRTQS